MLSLAGVSNADDETVDEFYQSLTEIPALADLPRQFERRWPEFRIAKAFGGDKQYLEQFKNAIEQF